MWQQLRAIEHEDPAAGSTFRVSCCIGVALLDLSDSHANDLIARADAALYAAKAGGRDCVMLSLEGVLEREPPPVIEVAVA